MQSAVAEEFVVPGAGGGGGSLFCCWRPLRRPVMSRWRSKIWNMPAMQPIWRLSSGMSSEKAPGILAAGIFEVVELISRQGCEGGQRSTFRRKKCVAAGEPEEEEKLPRQRRKQSSGDGDGDGARRYSGYHGWI